MNKQIEEMANAINEMDEPNAHYYGKNMKEHEAFADCFTIAKHLYNAGYRKHSKGKWKKRGNEKTCSLCKFIYYSNNDEWNFCPNCGAKMKGGE